MPKPEELILVVGPEGGFAREEVEFFVDRGALPVSLGPRILRAETAGPVTAALILYHYGEMLMNFPGRFFNGDSFDRLFPRGNLLLLAPGGGKSG